GRRADDVEGVLDIGDPVAQGFVHRVLERLGARCHFADFCTHQAHTEDIRLLPLHVDRAHVDDGWKTKTGGDGRGRDAVLSGAGLRDDARLLHSSRQQDLAEAIVDFVRARVVEIFALQINLRAAEMLGQALRKIEWTFAAGVSLQQTRELRLKRGIASRILIGALQLQYERHQRLGNEASTIGAEMPLEVGAGTKGIWRKAHARASFANCAAFAFEMKSAIKAALLTPGDVSTPDETSTPGAPLVAIARVTFSGVRPPARSQGLENVRPRRSCQSNALPWPPARAAPSGAFASKSSKSATGS